MPAIHPDSLVTGVVLSYNKIHICNESKKRKETGETYLRHIIHYSPIIVNS